MMVAAEHGFSSLSNDDCSPSSVLQPLFVRPEPCNGALWRAVSEAMLVGFRSYWSVVSTLLRTVG